MEQIAFTMRLNPGQADEYKRRHDAIWPALSALLHDAGIRDYSIFLDEESGVLFAVLRLAAGHRLADLPRHELMQRWWRFMGDIMATNADGSPQQVALRPVFHMD